MTGPQGSNGASEQANSASPLADNPPGYVQPGRGLEDLAGEDHAFKKAAHLMEQLDQRESVASGSGGFRLDVEAMRSLQTDWEDLAKDLNKLRDDTLELGNAVPPANEGASRAQIKAVYQHARVCANIHEQMYVYAKEYSGRLSAAIAKIEASDQGAGDSMQSMERDV